MRKLNIDMVKINEYISSNSDKRVDVLYNELKSKKTKDLSDEEFFILTYLKLNKKKLGIK